MQTDARRVSRVGELSLLCESPLGTVEEGALIIARDAQPSLLIPKYLARLDELADRVAKRLDRSSTLKEQIVALRLELFEREGLRGNDKDYYDPRNSYVNEVLDRRLGIPISLAVVVLAVCRRVGIVAEGVGFPGHFLVRLGGPAGTFADPFQSLRLLASEDLDDFVKQRLGPTAQVRASHLETTDLRSLLVRMLSNLRAIHDKRGDKRSALSVCDRLVELNAGLPAIRDRGLYALDLGSHAAAVHDLETYLAKVENPVDKDEVTKALARAKAKTSWN